jgi:hypothetical protein
MYVRQLHVENLKLLRDATIDFTREGAPRMWTVLIGENGLCKTSILHAIAMCAVGPVRAKALANLPSLRDRRLPPSSKEHVRLEASFGFSKRHDPNRGYPPDIGLRWEKPPILTSTLQLLTHKTAFDGSSQYDLEPTNDDNPLEEARDLQLNHWFVAGYGVDRNLPTPRSTRTSPEDRTVDRLLSLFGKGSIIGTGFADLFREDPALVRRYQAALRRVLVAGGLLPNIRDLDLGIGRGIRRASDIVDSQGFQYRAGARTAVRIPPTWLSQGYQATISWVADVVGQVFFEAGGAVAPRDMEGLVLVDEIDLHLHPTWQARIVDALRKAFPRLQFVVTTHSPMVLPALAADELVLLKRCSNGDIDVIQPAPTSPQLLTGSELYRDFFGLERRPPTTASATLWRYGLLANDPYRSDASDQEMRRLRTRLRKLGAEPEWQPVPRKKRSS